MIKKCSGLLLYFVLVGFFLLASPAVAQQQKVDFFSINDGLTQSSVNTIFQDSEGLIWIGTQDGLNRYDGHTFESFKNIPFDSTSLADNFINCIFQDSKGRLWVGTSVGGLHLYHPKRNVFQRFKYQRDISNSIANNRITLIYEAPDNSIWVGTIKGFSRLIEEGNDKFSFQNYYQKTENNEEKRSTAIKSLYAEGENKLWVGTYLGLNRFEFNADYSIKKITEFELDNYPIGPKDNAITGIFRDNYNRLWIASHKGLNHYLETEKKFVFYPKSVDKKLENEDMYYVVLEDNKIVGHSTSRIYDFSLTKEGLGEPKYRTRSSLIGKETSYILRYQKDKLNPKVQWIGTGMEGLAKITTFDKRFEHNNLQEAKKAGLKSVAIFGVVKRKNGILWLSDRNGLLRHDIKKNTYQYFEPQDFAHERLEFRTIFEDSNEIFWVGTNRGLIKLDIDNKGQLSYKKYYQENCDNRCHITSISEAENGLLLISGFQGVHIYNPETDQLLPKTVVVDSTSYKKMSYGLSYILKDRRNNVWVAAKDGGLALYRNINNSLTDLYTTKPTIYRHNEQDLTSLLSDDINLITEDQHGTIWLSTFIGIVKVELQSDGVKFTNFTEKDGLCNNAVYGMLEDTDKGDLWASTNNGLSRLNIKTETFTTFRSEPGLQSNEFNGNGFFKSADGEMIFSGINGYSSFYPSKIKKDPIAPKVSLKQLTTASGKVYNLMLQKEPTVVLPYRQNTFTISYTGVDFVYPDQINFAYSMGETPDSWIPVNTDRRIVFNSFPSGENKIHIRAANRDGVWSEEYTTLLLSINTPFWKAKWFYLMLFGLLLLSGYGLHKLRWRRKLEKIKEFEEFRKETAQDFHDELGSKLTVISLFSQITKEKLNGQGELVEPYLDKVIDTSNSLYLSMKDLLWSINPEKDSIYDLALHLKDFGDELFDITTIHFKTEGIDSKLLTRSLPMKYKRHILLIFKEAMNNILKHADCNSVCLRMHTTINALQISIEDNGKGFCHKEPKTGDGLKNMKNRAEVIQGVLTIRSTKEGTKIVLECPLSQETKPKRTKV